MRSDDLPRRDMEPDITDPDAAMRSIVQAIEDEHAAWLAVLDGLSQEQLTEPGGHHGSSVLGMFLHVGSWKENAVKVARLQAEPDAAYPPQEQTPAGVLGLDAHEYSQSFAAAHGDWTLEQSLEWSTKVHQALLRWLRDLPADRTLGGIGPHGARLWYWSPAVIVSERHRQEAGDRFS